MRCRWTSTWIILHVKFSGVSLNLNSKCLTSWLSYNVLNLVKICHSNSRRRFCPSVCNFEEILTILICLPMHRLIGDSRRSYQDTIQNLKRRRPLCAENWWLFHHLSKTNISMNDFPNQLFPLLRSHLVQTPILQICRTFVSMWGLLYSWWNDKCPSCFLPMNTADSIVTVMNISINQRMFFVVFCNIHQRSFLSFPHLIINHVQERSGSHWQYWFCFVVSNDELLRPRLVLSWSSPSSTITGWVFSCKKFDWDSCVSL